MPPLPTGSVALQIRSFELSLHYTVHHSVLSILAGGMADIEPGVDVAILTILGNRTPDRPCWSSRFSVPSVDGRNRGALKRELQNV